MKASWLIRSISIAAGLFVLTADCRSRVAAAAQQGQGWNRSDASKKPIRQLRNRTTRSPRRVRTGGFWARTWLFFRGPGVAEQQPLSAYKQWQEEVGYWIGEYTFYQGDGTTFGSVNFNYPYDSYMGFITGNIDEYVHNMIPNAASH